MNLVKVYSSILKNNLDNPSFASILIKFGLDVAYGYVSLFPDRRLPQSFQYLNKLCIKWILDPLARPLNSAWVNIFAPTEFLHAMNISPLFIEAYSSFMSGYDMEALIIDKAESTVASNTLCSFHKTFIGAAELNLLKPPKIAITTSMACDANINTFRYLAGKYDIPLYVIDVPIECNEHTVDYVKRQLMEMVSLLEGVFKQKLNLDKLRFTIRCENETRRLMKQILCNLRHRSLSSTMTFELYMLFTSHVFMGHRETLTFYKMFLRDLKKAPARKKAGIFFIHLPPLYESNFKHYFNFNCDYEILGCDLNYDFMDEIELTDPFKGIARKLILNTYNGGFETKLKVLSHIIDTIMPDGIIQFCHWGCKQSFGNVGILKDFFTRKGSPFLVIDGDIVDKRNNQEGQVGTRLEAFLEMMESRGGDGIGRVHV
jgi:benzoyl-CoA reductase/2-hydroxyglutaryl-CoA dehydratase subunit BcrC/BadD/HgdB